MGTVTEREGADERSGAPRKRPLPTRRALRICSAAAVVALAALAAGCSDDPSVTEDPPAAASTPAGAPTAAPTSTSFAREFEMRDARAAASVEELERRRADVEALVRNDREVAALHELSVSPDTGTITVDVSSTFAGRSEPREDLGYRLAATLAGEIWSSLDERLSPGTVPPSLAIRIDGQRFRCDGATMLAFARKEAGSGAFAQRC